MTKFYLQSRRGLMAIDHGLTPLKSIRKKCLWCMNDQSNEVHLCTCQDTCTLYPYRFGRRPDIKPALTPIKAVGNNQNAAKSNNGGGI